MKAIQVPAILDGVTFTKDGGASVRFHTNELSESDVVMLRKFHQKFGWLLFSEQEHDESELDLEEIRKDTGGKSPSQRLRSVLYIMYTQSGEKDVLFETYYARQMERFINLVKQNLRD